MKQIIPFNKEITFKTSVSDITSISLDHDLQLTGVDIIRGNFYIKGKFKMTKGSIIEEDFSYKIPCEIAISDDYDAYDATVDIDDFYYDLLDDSILKVNIAVLIDNLVKKEEEKRCIEIEETEEIEKEDKPVETNEDLLKDNEEETKELNISFETEENTNNKKVDISYKEKERINPVNVIQNSNEDLFKTENKYQTYYVYLTKDEDSFETLKEKYKVSREQILDYNDITDITPGIKVIIPQCNNEWSKGSSKKI